MKKIGKPLWYALIVFGLFAIVYGVIISFINIESVPLTYQNPAYSYNITYPEDWELYDDAPDYPDYVGIFTEDDLAAITIEVSCDMWTIDESVSFFIENIVNNWDDAQIKSNDGPVDRWDWVIEYEYIRDDTLWLAKGYFLQNAECSFILSYFAGVSYVWVGGQQYPETTDSRDLCESIIDTFQLTSQ